MTLEGFEIENWSCIQRVCVKNLPASGVVVICGPNRRGKSSIVQALRACLMDNAATSTALKSWYPRGTGDKPTVSVTFRSGGQTYRIRKQFGSSKSDLTRRLASGEWKLETASAAEAHSRTCELVGGEDSQKGLNQLLWLTQAEFRLPEPKKFDNSVQARLRGMLGVLQTPLDDQFSQRVKQRWSRWHSGQRKAGKPPALKESSELAGRLRQLEKLQLELRESDNRFAEAEGLIRQAADLNQTIRSLTGDLERQQGVLAKLQEEQQRSQARIATRRQAEELHRAAEKDCEAVLAEQTRRAEAVQRWQDEEQRLAPATAEVEAASARCHELENKHKQQVAAVSRLREQRREQQVRLSQVRTRLQSLDDAEKVTAAEEVLVRARKLAADLETEERFVRENPAPDAGLLEQLKENRQKAARLEAQRDAASMQLSLEPEAGARDSRLRVDNSQIRKLAAGEALTLAVRRIAQLQIEGWGTVELTRGSGQEDLEQLEEQLQRCQDEFTASVAVFGVAGRDADALTQLLVRHEQRKLKLSEAEKLKRDLKAVAPQGLEPLETKIRQLHAKVGNAAALEGTGEVPLPGGREELEKLADSIQQESMEAERATNLAEKEADATSNQVDLARTQESAAREVLASCTATVGSKREELGRMSNEADILARMAAAQEHLAKAKVHLVETELSPEELTIDERLGVARTAVSALIQQQTSEIGKLNIIRGRLMEAEGLHARRSSLAARVDELSQATVRESLEREAIDRLYALFEECREKQLGTLLGPVHDRVLTWMRDLDIGNYQEMRFNDAFLPDKLMRRGEGGEMGLDEESTGAQEQIGMLVRLALGSVLASPTDGTVAILDDPLTHSDVNRLNRMRSILRRAAEGDASLVPPAGPLQIVIFTCHPEWFRDDTATVIDLEDPQVMTRFAV